MSHRLRKVFLGTTSRSAIMTHQFWQHAKEAREAINAKRAAQRKAAMEEMENAR